MKILVTLFIIFSPLMLISQQQTFDEMVKSYYKNTVPLIYPHQLYQKILSGEKIYLLDSRETKEYEVSFINGAIKVGYNNFKIETVKNLSKSTPVIVYCTIGARSEQIGEKLQKAGFNQVYNLYGGIIHWKNQGYPVYSSTQSKTPNIHVYSKEWGIWLTNGKAIH